MFQSNVVPPYTVGANSWKDIVFKWIGNSSITYNSKNPMSMGDLVLTDKFIKPNCEKEYPGTGNFSCVDGYFMMEREIGYYVTYAFLPSLMTWSLHSVTNIR